MNLNKLFWDIQHLSAKRNAFPTLYAAVCPRIIINQCEILHCAGFWVFHHVGNVVFGQAIDDVDAMGARHAVAASCTVVSKAGSVGSCNLPDYFLIIFADEVLFGSYFDVLSDLLHAGHSA